MSNYALYLSARDRADRAVRRVRQTIARLETGYRIGRILVAREVLKQAPTGFSAATKCFCTEHEIAVAEFVAQVFGPEATLWSPTLGRPGLHARIYDHGWHIERDAQHSG